MQNAKLKVVRFENNDVITTSTAPPVQVSWSGLFDGKEGNAKISYKGVEYSASQLSSLNTALTGTGVTITGDTEFNTNEQSYTFAHLTNTDGFAATQGGDNGARAGAGNYYNGYTFTWDSKTSTFQ